MTLSEFLLARIADDQKWARQRRDEDFRKHRVSARRPHLAPDDAERVLAQCEVYRSIVERRTCDNAPDCGDHDCMTIDEDRRLLASVYAGHPDYRQEWRP